jgi:hypothetical protein
MYRRDPREQASEVSVDIVGSERTKPLLDRHNDLWRADKIAEGIKKFAREDAKDFANIRQLIGNHGGFIMKYPKKKIEGRLIEPEERRGNGHWVVAEASAKITTLENGDLVTSEKNAWADCQCYVPADHPTAELDPSEIELPRSQLGDHVFSKSTLQKIEQMPACVGCLSDLCAADKAAHLGLASAARKHAFDHILNLNREFPIRYLTAEIFSIRGLILPDGTTIYPPVSITNFASILMHEHSRFFPAYLAWVKNERLVEVHLDGHHKAEPHYLITDWFVMVYDFDVIRKLKDHAL